MNLVLDDMGEFRDIDAARRDISGNEKSQGPFTHAIEHALPGRLGEIGAQTVGIVAEALQHRRHVIDFGLGVAKDYGTLRVFDLDHANQTPVFLHGRYNHVGMLGFSDAQVRKDLAYFGMHSIAAEAEQRRLGQELSGQTHDMRGISGGKHVGIQRLAGQVLPDPLHIRIEPHR